MAEFSGVLRIGDSLYCKGCRLTFKEQKDLDIHIITCTRPANGTAFVMMADLRGGLPTKRAAAEPVRENEKIVLPDSQTNSSQNSEEGGTKEKPHPCHLCIKSFGNARGLKQHLVSCKKKAANRRQQRPIIEGEAPAIKEIPPQNVPQTGAPQTPPENPARAPQNQIWGDHSYTDLMQIVSAVYDEIVYWKKNLFKLPSGAAGIKISLRKQQN